MDSFSSASRARKVARILKREYADRGEDAVPDLLADVRHYCDEHNLDYAERDAKAHVYYLPEALGVAE
jgi:hypothetical protein